MALGTPIGYPSDRSVKALVAWNEASVEGLILGKQATHEASDLPPGNPFLKHALSQSWALFDLDGLKLFVGFEPFLYAQQIRLSCLVRPQCFDGALPFHLASA